MTDSKKQNNPAKLDAAPLDNTLPANWTHLLDSDAVKRAIARMSYEIVERNLVGRNNDHNGDLGRLAIVGIRTCGEFIGKRLRDRISEIENINVPFGVIDITLYRDDLGASASQRASASSSNASADTNRQHRQPTVKGTDLPFSISGSRIVLVDDVFYTGRTVRAALDAIIDFGRPACVELAALLDRGHREFPIRPDYVGKNIPTGKQQSVRVRLEEQGFEDGAYLINHGAN